HIERAVDDQRQRPPLTFARSHAGEGGSACSGERLSPSRVRPTVDSIRTDERRMATNPVRTGIRGAGISIMTIRTRLTRLLDRQLELPRVVAGAKIRESRGERVAFPSYDIRISMSALVGFDGLGMDPGIPPIHAHLETTIYVWNRINVAITWPG